MQTIAAGHGDKASEAAHGGADSEIAAAADGGHQPDVVRFADLVTRAPALAKTFSLLSRLAATEVPILLLGETGCGKTTLARAIHQVSPRAVGPLVVLNSATLESAGARAPAPSEVSGAPHLAVELAFEQARGGTLLIDEVADLSLEAQTRLLRALETSQSNRGVASSAAPEARAVATSNRELDMEVAAGRLRADLYFRLAGAIVRVPALRERQGDLALLVPQLLSELGQPLPSIDAAVYEWLSTRAWPGNVRELKNALAFALAHREGAALRAEDLRAVPQADDDSVRLARLPLAGLSLARVEQAAIQQTLGLSRGNKMQAARMLGIAVSTLYEKLKRYQIP